MASKIFRDEKKCKPTPVMKIKSKDIKDRPLSESEWARICYLAKIFYTQSYAKPLIRY